MEEGKCERASDHKSTTKNTQCNVCPFHCWFFCMSICADDFWGVWICFFGVWVVVVGWGGRDGDATKQDSQKDLDHRE